MDNVKGNQLRNLLNVFCDQEDFSLRIEDPHLLDGVVQILRQLAVMIKKKTYLIVFHGHATLFKPVGRLR